MRKGAIGLFQKKRREATFGSNRAPKVRKRKKGVKNGGERKRKARSETGVRNQMHDVEREGRSKTEGVVFSGKEVTWVPGRRRGLDT